MITESKSKKILLQLAFIITKKTTAILYFYQYYTKVLRQRLWLIANCINNVAYTWINNNFTIYLFTLDCINIGVVGLRIPIIPFQCVLWVVFIIISSICCESHTFTDAVLFCIYIIVKSLILLIQCAKVEKI